MYLEQLGIAYFRNLAELQLQLDSRSIVLRGGNGQGKTNLLEAVYLCATGRSFRNAAPRELLRYDSESAWIKARVQRRGVRHQVEVALKPRHRSIRVDGRGLRQTARLLETLNVVAFFPDDLRIAKGAPEERRRFLDRTVANYRPEFVDASIAYSRAVKSRNALLRAEQTPDRRMVESYDEQLVIYGEVIHRCRVDALALLAPVAGQQFAHMLPDAAPLHMALHNGLPENSDTFVQDFRRALVDTYPRDRARGTTSVGTHRADLLLSLGDKAVRAYASQGQQRAIVLALKLAELETLRKRLGTAPILLLDDVSSELDTERTGLLFEALNKNPGQVWLTTTGAAPLPLTTSAQVFEVQAGRVSPA